MNQSSVNFQHLYYRLVQLELQRVANLVKVSLPNEDLSGVEENLNANELGLALEDLFQIVSQNESTPEEVAEQIKILAEVMSIELKA